MSSPFEQYLAELSDLGQPLIASKLAILSDLIPEEVRLFFEAWPHIDVVRRRQVLHRLMELAEDNLELDFDGIFLACLGDEDGETRATAIEGLRECADPALIDHLTALLLDDAEQPVREAAAVALGKFAMLAELGKLLPGDARKVEETLLNASNNMDEVDSVRCKVLEAIAPLSKPHVEDLIRGAYHGSSRELKASALYAMGQNCNPSWLPLLLTELHSPHPRLRFEAARACAELEAEEAVPRLVELLDDGDALVRMCAIEALGRTGGSEAKAALQECLDSSDESVREAAQEALQEMGSWDEPLAP